MSVAFAGVGIAFKRGDAGTPEVFTAIAEITSISGPNMSRDTIETTSLDTTDGYRTFIGSFRDGGEIALEMNFNRDGWDQFKTDFESAALKNYQIDMTASADPDDTVMDFAALVTALGVGVTTDDKVTAPVTLKVSGAVTTSSG